VVVANNITYPGKAVLVNNTIVHNTATSGGGIYVHESTAEVMNTIIWGNQAPNEAAINTYNSSIDVAYCDVQGRWTGMGNINLEPQFESGETLYHLSSSSPCVNTGIDSMLLGGIMCHCPCTDFEGNSRPFPGTPPDMGWDETDVPVGIQPVPVAGIPESYALSQNYPNPFNPSTTLKYELPRASHVTLTVYDLLGREVTTLVNAIEKPGYKSVEWNASGVASGVYFYRLQAGNFVQTRKLLLLR
jgi:hypothetical protein